MFYALWFFYWKLLQYIANINMQLLSMQTNAFFLLQSSFSVKKIIWETVLQSVQK